MARSGSERASRTSASVIVTVRGTLNVEAWDGGPGLASLYDWLHAQLVQANLKKDPAITEGCLSLVTDLADTWRAAALQAAATS